MWPEGAIFARDMERGFQCRTPNPSEQFLQDAFNCDKDSIASTVLQLWVTKLFTSVHVGFLTSEQFVDHRKSVRNVGQMDLDYVFIMGTMVGQGATATVILLV